MSLTFEDLCNGDENDKRQTNDDDTHKTKIYIKCMLLNQFQSARLNSV